MDFLRCGFCGATATTARFTELLAPHADGIHRSCACGADGVAAASEMDIQDAAAELVLDRLQLDIAALGPFSRLRAEIEGQGYDAVLLPAPNLALWVRPARTKLVERLSSTAELPSPVTFDGDERDRVLMLRLPPHPGARALLVDVAPVRVGAVRACLRVTGGTQPPAWSHLGDDAWATQLTLAQARGFAEWCGKRVPDDDEWQRLVAPDVAPHLRAMGELWEWTTTVHPRGGFVVRGGPWRDRGGRGTPTNRSREDRAAIDLAVRLVRDG